MSLETVRALHERAMKLLDEAEGDARKYGQPQTEKLAAAFEAERDAALLVEPHTDTEPTRSILFRSAGTLAFRCGYYRDAANMVHRGLSGNPPAEIADELRELQEQIEAKAEERRRNTPVNPRYMDC